MIFKLICLTVSMLCQPANITTCPVASEFSKNKWQVEMLVGQVNFRGCFPLSASNVLEPMLHPER